MARVPSDSKLKSSVVFKNRFIALVAEQDCTIYEFAKNAGVSKSVVTRAAIYGIIPSVKLLIKIANALNTSLTYLLGMTEIKLFEAAPAPSDFHARLNALRCEREVKVSEIGAKMPFSTNLFYEWERVGTIPSLEYLIAIAKYFEVSIDYLLGRTDDRA